MKVCLVQLFCNGNFKGYRTISRSFYDEVLKWSKNGKANVDIELVLLREWDDGINPRCNGESRGTEVSPTLWEVRKTELT